MAEEAIPPRSVLARISRRADFWAFLAFASLGFGYCFITPPFRGPDERNHFLRSYQVSEFRFVGHRLPDGFTGDELPAALAQLSDAVGNHDDNRLTEAQLAAARAVTLDPAQRQPIEFSNTTLYSPIAYIPAAVAIRLGRALGISPLHLFYLARIANVLATSCLIALAVRRLGYARWPALLAVSLPMAVSQMSLVTADAFTFAFCFFWIAWVAELATADTTVISPKRVAALCGVALLLSQLRPPYPLLALAIFAVPLRRFGGRWMAALAPAAVLLAAILPAVAWNVSARPLFVPDLGFDLQNRVTVLREGPLAFVRAAQHDIARRGADRWSQAVGRFGWLNIPLPSALTTGYAAALALSCLLAAPDLRRPRWWQRAIWLATAVIGMIAIQVLLFVTYDLGWIQGRYLIPFVAVLAFAAGGLMTARERLRTVLLIGCILIAAATHAASLLAIARASGV